MSHFPTAYLPQKPSQGCCSFHAHHPPAAWNPNSALQILCPCDSCCQEAQGQRGSPLVISTDLYNPEVVRGVCSSVISVWTNGGRFQKEISIPCVQSILFFSGLMLQPQWSCSWHYCTFHIFLDTIIYYIITTKVSTSAKIKRHHMILPLCCRALQWSISQHMPRKIRVF